MLVDFTSPQPNLELEKTPKEMLSVTELEDGRRKVRINSSSLGIILQCMRKAELSLKRSLKSKVEAPATLHGSAIHAAMETFYGAPLDQRVLPPNFEGLAGNMAAFDIEEEEEFLVLKSIRAYLDKAAPLRALPSSDKRSIDAGIWTLTHYFTKYIDDPYVVMVDHQGAPYVERPCHYTLFEDANMVIEYFGTIDVILKNAQNGTVVVCDHKTSSMVGKDFYNRLKPNHQYTGYVLGARRALGINTDKFMVNCIQVKSRPTTKRGGPPTFPRQVTLRTEEDFTEFEVAVTEAVKRYLNFYDKEGWPIGHVDACAMYGGCQFLDVCSSPGSVRESVIKSKFEEVPYAL